ncbi:MAG: ergothioneine biosynthesis protein EgtC [Deltaproteobacteria bacterium]|nr:MAG: ergothioneine biosynthesis protein EgtC [Deltaproteobacteria bacterium]
MCRMAGYAGPAIRLGEIVSAPVHSLLVQSYRPREMQSGTVNADGFGAALWLDDGRPEPALYRTAVPIWADPNLGWMGDRLRVRCTVAAVRSATPGVGFELANVQPFAHERLAFAHNGFIRDFRHGAQRLLRERLGNKAYESIAGTSDSEHIFALIIEHGVRGAIEALEEICRELKRPAVATLLLADGEELIGLRWARGAEPATLYFAPFGEGVCLASEPLDGAKWRELPADAICTARPGSDLAVEPLR